MSRSPEEEQALYEEALALFAAGKLAKARRLFEQIAHEGGKYLLKARYYLGKIKQMDEPTRGPSRGSRPTRDEGPVETAGSTPTQHDRVVIPPDLDGDFPAEAPGGPPDRGLPMSPPMSVPPRDVPGAEAESAAAPSNPQPLRRTPHMDLSATAPVDPGTQIQVSVYTDVQTFRDGETGLGIEIDARPDQKRFEVDVWLTVGEPYTVQGDVQGRLVILRDQEKSEPVEFTVLRLEGPEPAEPVLISALFSYKGRPCGRVSREMVAKPNPQALPESGLQIDANAKRPDLSVRIVRKGTDKRVYDCRVQTHLLPEYKDGVIEEWQLPDISSEFVKRIMAQFTAGPATPFARMLALKGAGIELFEASPDLFRKVFWELIDQKRSFRSISIVTEEPSIPWELMVPTRNDEELEPLGVRFLLSRWTARDNILPAQRLNLRDAFVVAPRDSKLKNAEEEVNLIAREFSSLRIDPVGLESLNLALNKGGRSLLHFICHGKSGDAGNQTLWLENQEPLTANQLRAMPGAKKAIRDNKPFIFLNACEVGRQEPALSGAGGFAETFMAMGASAVIAPLWSVKDSIAHEIAEAFYERVKKEPETPFAQILADLRKQSYAESGGEDTYAAYCFYGDPLARRAAL